MFGARALTSTAGGDVAVSPRRLPVNKANGDVAVGQRRLLVNEAGGDEAVGQHRLPINEMVASLGLGPLEARLAAPDDEDEPKGLFLKNIQVKGIFPIDRAQKLGFVTSVFDRTDGSYEPVNSALNEFQDDNTVVYQHSAEVGCVDPNKGFTEWVKTGVVVPQILETPGRGVRQLVALVRLVDLDNKPIIANEYNQPDHPGLIWQRNLPFDCMVDRRGYLELPELSDEARSICVRIAMILLVRNSSLDSRATEMLKRWMVKNHKRATGERQSHLRIELIRGMREGYHAVTNRDFDLKKFVQRLNDIDDNGVKYAAIDLCLDVMTTDETVRLHHFKLVDSIARALNLDLAEIMKIRDIRISGLAALVTNDVKD